jgi:hypothetical protein
VKSYYGLGITVLYRLLFAALILMTPVLAAGQLYRCVAADGQLTFQDIACQGTGAPLYLQLHQPSDLEIARVEQRRQQLREHLRWGYLHRAYQQRLQIQQTARIRRAEERQQAALDQQAADDALARGNDRYRVVVRYRMLHRRAFHRRSAVDVSHRTRALRSGCTVTTLGCDMLASVRVRSNRPLQRHHRSNLPLRLRIR